MEEVLGNALLHISDTIVHSSRAETTHFKSGSQFSPSPVVAKN